MADLSKPNNGQTSLTNYVAFNVPESQQAQIGHYDLQSDEIQPLSFKSGTPIESLYQVIEAGESNIKASGAPLKAHSVKILPPLTGRDVLCVGKNYAEHAKEFNSSGFDSSDKVDQPSHPVIFTKRFSSIIATGEEIYPHPEFTQTADYEGEIAVIIGKHGFRIPEEEAMNHVWGYTIVNDMTARERQRDHKQFYIGKSPDTFYPMGPVAVPASKLDKVLRVQTHVNGELRQDATTDDLIFSIPFLIKTMSEGQTLMPGDVLATGTPVGVGIGRKPPTYLQTGDVVTVTVSGLGKLENRIADSKPGNATVKRIEDVSHIRATNAAKSVTATNLTTINNKPLHYKTLGQPSAPPIVFIHGLGGTFEYWTPLIHTLGLEKTHSLHLFDLEGHGLSPTSPLSVLSIASFAEDLNGVFEHANIETGATLIVHSMGCLIAATFALAYPNKVSKLGLLGPPASPLPEMASERLGQRAELARTKGMASVVDAIVSTGTSEKTKSTNPLAFTAVRILLLGQDPEGHAKAVSALAASANDTIAFGDVKAQTLIVTGAEDVFAPPALCEKYKDTMSNATLKVLDSVGHWHVFEDLAGVAEAVSSFL